MRQLTKSHFSLFVRHVFLRLGFVLALLLLSNELIAQTQEDFRGIYNLDSQEGIYLLIKPAAERVSGFLFGPAQALRISGRYTNQMLELRFDEGEDTTVNYAGLDADGNLQLSDGMFNVLMFRKTPLNVDSAYDKLSKPVLPAADGNAPSPAAAGSRYADKKFLHLYTANGFTEKWAYYLYADGRFRFRGADSYNTSDASGNFSAATGTDDTGNWVVTNENGAEYLLLKWDNGSSKKMQIMRNANGYELNGSKYFLVGLSEYE